MPPFHYLPLTPGFFSILVAVFAVVLLLVQLRLLRYAYMRLGVGSGTALILLAATLVGSYFNIPITQTSGLHVISPEVVDYFGMRYQVPVLINQPGTLIAVNLGGAVIPTIMSVYLLARYELWFKGAIAVLGVAAFIHRMAEPVPGLGIAVPIFAPSVGTAIAAVMLARERAAPLAYIAGSLGTLVGADLLNLDNIGSLGTSIASIGGAGTFDGIFLTGIVAVLLASFYAPPAPGRAA
jgi:uncharacterized membrane protein